MKRFFWDFEKKDKNSIGQEFFSSINITSWNNFIVGKDLFTEIQKITSHRLMLLVGRNWCRRWFRNHGRRLLWCLTGLFSSISCRPLTSSRWFFCNSRRRISPSRHILCRRSGICRGFNRRSSAARGWALGRHLDRCSCVTIFFTAIAATIWKRQFDDGKTGYIQRIAISKFT